ncbi:MAG TPA: sugar ABC transporter permease [Pseudolysinimonas sp.]|nr:sugar ABC transporter permease [Pseudolysinimonas sp.]
MTTSLTPRAATVPRRGARPGTGRRLSRRLLALVFVLPALALYAAFVLVPAGQTFYLSFFSWDGITQAIPVGFENYLEVVTNPLLLRSITNAMVLIVYFAVIPIAAGLLIVALAGRRQIRGMGFFRAIIFLPQVLPMVAIGIIWRWMYEPDGLVNQALQGAGLAELTRAWLGDPDWALIAVGLVGTWALTGLCMTLFFAGMYKIDTELYDAVSLDGGGRYRQFLSVTLPGLSREIRVALTLTIIAALASFDLVYVTTNGSPANLTVVPGLLVYRLAFNSGQIGAASALAVVLMALVLLVLLLAGRLGSKARD